jgi:hypothetical protein
MNGDRPSFLAELFPNIRGIPLHSWLLMVVAAALLTLPDMAQRPALAGVAALSPAALVLGIIVGVVALYSGAIGIIGRPLSLAGGVKFLLVYALTVVPFLTVMITVAVLGTAEADRYAILWLPGILLASAMVILLPAWPVAASLSPHNVSPLRVFSASKGCRWGLFCATMFAASNNRLSPDVVNARDGGTAAFYALVGASLTVFGLAIMASAAATAWQFATRKDETLAAAAT